MRDTLKGIVVVALEQAVAAPYVSGRLARMGATVIKIERPEGDFARGYDRVVDGESAYFVWLNGGKQSRVLDIKQAAAAAELEQLIASADVFIQNLAPGAASRAGFDSLALRQRHPRLITCDISGYGEEGDYASRKAYDLLVQAESGLAMITGSPEAPGRSGVSVCDIAAGMHALTGILEALIARQTTGAGVGIKVSLFDGMADWMSVPLLHQEYTGLAPARVGLRHPGIAPYGVVTAGDGETVLLSIQNEREWHAFCATVMETPDLADDPRFINNDARVVHRELLEACIANVTGCLTGEALRLRLDRAGIAYGALNSVEALSRHPQLRRLPQRTPGGEFQAVAPPVRFQDNTGRWIEEPILTVPALGADAAVGDTGDQ